MRRFIDHVLVVLPFEVAALRDLGGPPATYVGHPLLFDKALSKVREARTTGDKERGKPPQLVVLPGSRRTEIRSLMPLFGETVTLLLERMPHIQVTLPTLPQLSTEIKNLAQNWPLSPNIVTSATEKYQAFTQADGALAASGTVSLELALAQVPMVLCYKADWFARHFILPKITIWSAALPNIIADEPIVPEYYNEFIRPAMLVRQLQRHMTQTAARQAQYQGFAALLQKMQNPLDIMAHPALSPSAIAATTVLDLIFEKQR